MRDIVREWCDASISGVRHMRFYQDVPFQLGYRVWRLFGLACCRQAGVFSAVEEYNLSRLIDGAPFSHIDDVLAAYSSKLREVVRVMLHGYTLHVLPMHSADAAIAAGIDPCKVYIKQGEILETMIGYGTFNPEWCTDSARGLASAIYHDHAFGTMPILADALEDAGCVNDRLLRHCRGSGPFYRGNWILDMILNMRGNNDSHRR